MRVVKVVKVVGTSKVRGQLVDEDKMLMRMVDLKPRTARFS